MKMKFHEFGCKNEKIFLMFHGSCMTWDMYEKSIKIMDAGHGEYCLKFPDEFAADILQRLEKKVN